MQSEAPDRSSNDMVTDPRAMSSEDNTRKEEFVDDNVCKQDITDDKSWKALQKGLLEKGMEIFGRNRSAYVWIRDACLICLFRIITLDTNCII